GPTCRRSGRSSRSGGRSPRPSPWRGPCSSRVGRTATRSSCSSPTTGCRSRCRSCAAIWCGSSTRPCAAGLRRSSSSTTAPRATRRGRAGRWRSCGRKGGREGGRESDEADRSGPPHPPLPGPASGPDVAGSGALLANRFGAFVSGEMVQFVQVSVRPPRGYMDHVPSQPTSDMLTVLVVDDDRELRESLCAFLRHRGCSVTAAAGGVEGLQAVILDAFDVVVTDTQLHGSEWFWREATTVRPGLRGRFIF